MLTDTFCSLAWLGASSITGNGVYRPCCTFNPVDFEAHWLKDINTNISHYDSLRKDLLNGIKRKECINCWNLESVGKNSLRQHANDKFASHYDNIIASTDDNGSTTITPVYFDMKMSNLCNLGCRMCSPGISSVIEAEVKNNPDYNWTWYDKNMPMMSGTWEENAFKQISQYKNITDLKFTGGEPFANPKIFDFLDSLQNKKNINLSFISNGLLISAKHFKLFDKFKSFQLNISCDGTEETYNYIRWPGTWKKFSKKFEMLKNKVENLSVVSVISAYNMHNIADMVDYFADIDFHMSPLFKPKFMYPYVQGIEYNFDTINHKDISSIVATKQDYNKDLHKVFTEQTNIRDEIRKQKFKFMVDCV